MGRAPCCEKVGLKKGAWSPEEDQKLVAYIQQHGHANWRALPKQAGLLRCGKSCRLRWINYLRPDIKRGNFSDEEEELIIRLHESLGNRWSAIAARLPGRTDNEIKNVWHTHLKKKLAEREAGKERKAKNVTTQAEPAAFQASSIAEHERSDASPERSSSTGMTSSAMTESTTVSSAADNAATTSASNESAKEESFTSEEFPPIDESFWSSSDMTPMDLGLSEDEMSLISSSRSEDMEFWLKLLLEAGDMKDLPLML